MANKHGNPNAIVLSDAQALPNATSVDSTNMAYVGSPTGNSMKLAVYANTAISIADTKALTINLQTWSADTASSAIAPFSTGGSALANSTPTYTIFTGTASGGAMAFAKGDLITSIVVPQDLMERFSTPHTYVQLQYITTADESSEKVDAIVYGVQ